MRKVCVTMRKKTFSKSRFPPFLFTGGASTFSLVSVNVSELVELALIASSFLIVGKKGLVIVKYVKRTTKKSNPFKSGIFW